MTRWAWLAIVSVGCGQPTGAAPRAPQTTMSDAGIDAPVPLSEDLPRLALRARQLYLDWRDAFSDPALDCATAATRMTELAERYADVLAANRDVLRAGRASELRGELDRYDAEIGPAARAIIEAPVMARCVNDPEFARAADRLASES